MSAQPIEWSHELTDYGNEVFVGADMTINGARCRWMQRVKFKENGQSLEEGIAAGRRHLEEKTIPEWLAKQKFT